MKYVILNTIKVISALTLEQLKPFKKAIKEKKFKSYLNNVFKDKDRLYLDFESKKSVKKPPIKLTKFLKEKDYDIVDYSKGLAKSNKSDKSNLVKIGKVLNKNKETTLLKEFNEDKNRTAGKKSDLLIVVSRHPYDIAGMSTGRGWKSCMNLDDGSFKQYVDADIKNGTLVAYIIDSNDKNINKPIARLLIKPYINLDDYKDIFLYPEKKVYGADVKGFRERIIKWLKTFQEFKGTYKFSTKLYNDEGDKLVGIGDKNSENYSKRTLYYINHPNDEDAKKDEDEDIKLTYYKNHPNDEDAKKEDDVIKELYYTHNPDDSDAKKDEDSYVRLVYYKNHQNDSDAKTDENQSVRLSYYKNHSNDSDAKTDESPSVRKLYYKNHPKDEDYKNDVGLKTKKKKKKKKSYER